MMALFWIEEGVVLVLVITAGGVVGVDSNRLYDTAASNELQYSHSLYPHHSFKNPKLAGNGD